MTPTDSGVSSIDRNTDVLSSDNVRISVLTGAPSTSVSIEPTSSNLKEFCEMEFSSTGAEKNTIIWERFGLITEPLEGYVSITRRGF
jgi:chaperonin GroEL (HSP60 family)